MIDFIRLFDDFEKNYDQLYHIILSYQQEFIEYVLSLKMGHKYVMGIMMLIKDLCENERISFDQLYEWVLHQMFCEEFYDYSFCYKFVDCLILLEKDVYKIFQDIVDKMNVNNSLSIQIAVASMYHHDDLFEKYPQIGQAFLDKVLLCVDKNEQFMKTVHMFLKPVLRKKHYFKYRIRFIFM